MSLKNFFSFISLVLVSFSLSANDDIPLWQDDLPGSGEPTDPRSIVNDVTASIESQVITISFNDLIASQVVVTDSNNLTVFNQTYSASYNVQANLSTLPTGDYTLRIYAYGEWWYGYFNL